MAAFLETHLIISEPIFWVGVWFRFHPRNSVIGVFDLSFPHVECVWGVWNDARLIHASFKAPPSMVGVNMEDLFTLLGSRVCIWKLNPADLAPHKISLISHTSSRKNLPRSGRKTWWGKAWTQKCVWVQWGHSHVSWTKTKCHCLNKNINNDLCTFYSPSPSIASPFVTCPPNNMLIVTWFFCSC